MTTKVEQVNDLIEQIGWGKYNNINFLVCGLAWSAVMLWGSTVSVTIKEAGHDWNLSSVEEGFLGTSQTLGLFSGAYFWGYIGNLKGRLKSLQIVGMLTWIFGLAYMLSVNYPMLSISIMCVGFCNGGSLVLGGTLYSESLPSSKKWTLVLLSICMVTGGIIAYASTIFVLIAGKHGISLWRWVVGIADVLQVFFWMSSFTVLESPKFLVRKNCDKKAIQILEKIAAFNKKDIDICLLTPVEYATINEHEDEKLMESKPKQKFLDLFSKNHMKKSILFGLAMFMSDISYSALSSFMPILLNKIGAEIKSDLDIYSTILAQVCLGIPGSILSAYLVTTRLGLKWTISIGFILSGVCVFLFLASNSYWMVLVSTSFINFFDFLGYSSLLAIVPESYPISIRSLGMGWANACCKFGGVVSPITVGLIFQAEGGMILGVFLISLFFGFVGICAAFFDEPRKKSIEF